MSITGITIHGSTSKRCCDLTGCCSDDSPESRQTVINFCTWEEREEFLDWLEGKGMKAFQKHINNPGKEIRFIYRGSEDHEYKENAGEVACIFID